MGSPGPLEKSGDAKGSLERRESIKMTCHAMPWVGMLWNDCCVLIGIILTLDANKGSC